MIGTDDSKVSQEPASPVTYQGSFPKSITQPDSTTMTMKRFGFVQTLSLPFLVAGPLVLILGIEDGSPGMVAIGDGMLVLAGFLVWGWMVRMERDINQLRASPNAGTADGDSRPAALVSAGRVSEMLFFVSVLGLNLSLLVLVLLPARPKKPEAPAPQAVSAPVPTIAERVQALTLLEQKLTGVDATHRFYQLADVAKAALAADDLDKAKAYADELLKLAQTINDWNTGNAIHHGHLVLGEIAMRENHLDDASGELILAGGTSGSPQLDSFGPGMLLAKELLERGRNDAVVHYLDLVAKFWKGGHALEWKQQILVGKTPDFLYLDD